MTRSIKILFVSNGHGEDAIGSRLARDVLEVARESQTAVELEAVPIVGRGDAYQQVGVKVSGPRWLPPSGGFTFTSLSRFLGDWRDGMRAKTHQQHWAVRRSKPDVVIVVGDVYALWVTFSFAFKEASPLVFQVQPLVSRYYQDGMTAQDRLERLNRVTVDSFTGVERGYMRRVERVYARDQRTADWLVELGVPQASFVGNLMMDALEPELELHPVLDGRPVLALLPGTRDDHVESLPKMLTAAALLPELQTFAALAQPSEKLELPQGWTWTAPTLAERTVTATRVALHESGARVPILERAFAALLHASSLVLGTSGTGNEQAVGLGVPVIGFPTRGPQFTKNFARAQKRLLGAGLTLLEQANPQIIAATARALRNDAAKLEAVKKAGFERMGSPGGSRRVAQEILARVLQTR
jgi:uncharacterized protein (TIGR03492 family)